MMVGSRKGYVFPPSNLGILPPATASYIDTLILIPSDLNHGNGSFYDVEEGTIFTVCSAMLS